MEYICDLMCDGLKLIQDDELYSFTSDSVILANFLKIKKGEKAVEIGAGSGVVSLLALAKNKDLAKIYAFEMQEKLAKICAKNVFFNKKSEKIHVLCQKIQNYEKVLKKHSVDVVFSNPPYFKDDGLVSPNEIKDIARRDKYLKVDELAQVTSDLLKSRGRFYCVYSSERSLELIAELKKHNLIVKKMFFTENGKGKVTLVVIEAVKDAKDGVKVLPNLITNLPDGKFVEELTTRKFL